MKRTTLLLTALGLVLVLAGWYLLVWSPRNDALTAAEVATTEVQAQQDLTRSRVAALQAVREEAPQLQAELAAAESLLPRDTSLPSTLRQLQQAADASNATLVSVSPMQPVAVEGATPGLYAIALNAEVRGSYFQIIDVLRRLEDPTISPRGMVWDNVSIAMGDEAPELVVALTGRMFSVLPVPPAVDTATTDAPAVDATDGAADAEPADDAGTETEVTQ